MIRTELNDSPITLFAYSYLLSNGIKFELTGHHKAYLFINMYSDKYGDVLPQYNDLLGTSLLDIIIEEYHEFKAQRNRDYPHKNKRLYGK